MGFFSALGETMKMGDEWQRTVNVKERMAQANAQMSALAAQMTPPPVDPAVEARRVPATATVQAAAQTPTWVNGNPLIRLDLIVELPSGVPLPVTRTEVVPQLWLGHVQPGSTLPVSLDPATPDSLRIEWNRAA